MITLGFAPISTSKVSKKKTIISVRTPASVLQKKEAKGTSVTTKVKRNFLLEDIQDDLVIGTLVEMGNFGSYSSKARNTSSTEAYEFRRIQWKLKGNDRALEAWYNEYEEDDIDQGYFVDPFIIKIDDNVGFEQPSTKEEAMPTIYPRSHDTCSSLHKCAPPRKA